LLIGVTGRNALVTGVSRRAGIGYAIAWRLLGTGAAVFIHGWTPHDATQRWGAGGTEAVARELGVRFVESDFADVDAPARVVATASDALGPLDILVVTTRAAAAAAYRS
jgi:3-oxoacyl-[acyl-carrier protein] reductase